MFLLVTQSVSLHTYQYNQTVTMAAMTAEFSTKSKGVYIHLHKICEHFETLYFEFRLEELLESIIVFRMHLSEAITKHFISERHFALITCAELKDYLGSPGDIVAVLFDKMNLFKREKGKEAVKLIGFEDIVNLEDDSDIFIMFSHEWEDDSDTLILTDTDSD